MKTLLIAFIGSLYVGCFGENSDVLSTDRFPEDDRFAPAIGNGHIATNVLSDTIYVNGVYNGYLHDSHRARIQSTASIGVLGDVITQKYDLHMFNGIFTHHVQLASCDVHISYFAHRKFQSVLVTLVKLEKNIPSQSCQEVQLKVNNGPNSTDFYLSTTKIDKNKSYTSGIIKEPETNTSERLRIHHFWTHIPDSVSINQGQKFNTFVFLTAIHTDKALALRHFEEVTNLDVDDIISSHTDVWNSIWMSGRIEVFGNVELQRTINACFYHILSSLPVQRTNDFMGLSPGGLSRGGKVLANVSGGPHNDYAGHVFWDMDTWIMPAILMFHPDMARNMIGSRIRVMSAVKQRALDNGFLGVQFPWEQAFTGYETCPWKPAADYQIHVTADVSLSLRHYLLASSDKCIEEILDHGGLELALEIARFWKSRTTRSPSGKYEILGVMGPDEYHFNINNSVFTNYNAKLSLDLPILLNNTYKKKSFYLRKGELEGFQHVSDNLRLLYDGTNDFHPQYDSFSPTEKIKQSDVVLLGFPLQMSMAQSARRNDLEMYEKVTDRFGPDTGTWSMHTVGWLELGEDRRAAENFKMMFRNINGPFKVFSEKPANSKEGPRCVNFITAAGGLLQAVVFGYGGIRLRENRIDISLHHLTNTSSWAMKGLKYRGFTLDLQFNKSVVIINLTNAESKKDNLILRFADKSYKLLKLNTPVKTEKRVFAFHVHCQETDIRSRGSKMSSLILIITCLFVFFTQAYYY